MNEQLLVLVRENRRLREVIKNERKRWDTIRRFALHRSDILLISAMNTATKEYLDDNIKSGLAKESNS